MLTKLIAGLALGASNVLAAERKYSTIQPSLTEIELAAATAVTNHITSDVKGKLFDRFVVIWLENTDFDKAYDNDDMLWLRGQGITLTNNWALSHPSQENYLGSVGGDYFALDDDRFMRMPANVSSIVDLLSTKGISWAEYQEDMPYSGYEGFQFKNQESGANDYVRKHNPLILYDSITDDDEKLGNIKNLTEFYTDLEAETLPQWMFITPNMTSDGHDSTIAVASKWSRDFLTPLLNNSYFMENTLVLLTFDENETYSIPNKIFGLLLGGVIKDSEKGTEDGTYYDHYSEISTIEDNWDLPHLGRFDVNANVYLPLANVSGWENDEVDTTGLYNNLSKVGYFNDDSLPLPAPNCDAINKNGKGILPAIESVWSASCHLNNAYPASFSTSATSASASSAPESSASVSSVSASSISTTSATSATSVSSTTTSTTSTPRCTDIGKDIKSFLGNLESHFGAKWSNELTNIGENAQLDTSEFPCCSLEKDGKDILEDILSYFRTLEKEAFIFKRSTNSSSNSTSSTSSSNEASSMGVTFGTVFAVVLVLIQLI